MTFLILTAVFLTVVLGVWGVVALLESWNPAVRRRLRELAPAGAERSSAPRVSLAAESEATPLRSFVTSVGGKVPVSPERVGETRRRLIQAGHRQPSTPILFTGIRVLAAVGLPLLLLATVVPRLDQPWTLVVPIGSAALGYLMPSFVLSHLIRRRKARITDALPDALDLLVVCVEAGLGLNQALMRVGNEIGRLEPAISEEFNLVNLEMRAGKTRIEALKNLSRRTGVQEISSLVSMLVQTDKFGTSVATSLRVFSDSMRTRRRQRAEEAAAKTTIKMVFPLVLCILPSMFVVAAGPAALHIHETLLKDMLRGR